MPENCFLLKAKLSHLVTCIDFLIVNLGGKLTGSTLSRLYLEDIHDPDQLNICW